jgi:CRP-like cAMP-binding protein
MADRKMDHLRRIPIFARCTKAELASLAQNTDQVDLEAGRTLIVQGRPNHNFCIILQGELDVFVDGKPIDHLGPGQFFGEISMLDGGPATATVTTTTPVEALVMSHAQFHNAIKAHETIALRVMAVMAERLRRMGLSEGFSS